jgi:hypothetical protein
MALYLDIRDAVVARIRALELFENVRITPRRKPSFVAAQDALPQVVVATREDLAERVESLQFGNSCNLVFEIYVGCITDSRWTDDQSLRRLDWREAIRLDLWNPLRLGLAASGEWDVDYDPQPAGGEPPPPNADGSWQRFDYKVKTARYTE